MKEIKRVERNNWVAGCDSSSDLGKQMEGNCNYCSSLLCFLGVFSMA